LEKWNKNKENLAVAQEMSTLMSLGLFLLVGCGGKRGSGCGDDSDVVMCHQLIAVGGRDTSCWLSCGSCPTMSFFVVVGKNL
jgi:hypothetical protein